MARSAQTRFLEDALANGLDSAAAKFPGAFTAQEIAVFRALPENRRHEELHDRLAYWKQLDEALSE